MKTKSTKPTLRTNHRKPKGAVEGMKGMPEFQPPRKRFAARTETVIMLMYSAICMRPKLIEEYSVWNPATSSVSPSGRSKGIRLTSAQAAMKYTRNAGNCTNAFHLKNHPAWWFTMSAMRNEPAIMMIPTHERPRPSSYENNCAEERSPPRSVNLLLADQPASMTPYTPSDVIAKM